MKRGTWALMMVLFMSMTTMAQVAKKTVKVLVLTERGDQHESFVAAAMDWLADFGKEHNYEFTEFNHADGLNKKVLKKYDVFLQLNYPPYTWSKDSEQAFIHAIEKGKIGWVGFHHATLLGEFDGYSMWDWFSNYMGGIRFKSYIAPTASGKVTIEAPEHPVMKGVSTSFVCPNDEWYTFNKNPRPNVHVLASVDESTYSIDTDVKMGDHPVIWSNEHVKARNVYFLMGHSKVLFGSEDFKKMFSNALLWAAGLDPQ